MRRTLIVAAAAASLAVFAGSGCRSTGGARGGQNRLTARRAGGQHQRNGKRLDAFWARAQQEVYKSADELAAQRARELRKGLRYDELWRGDPQTPVVALTFDDGPHPDFTPKLLDILKRENVKATFFVVGRMAEQYPQLIRAERAAGHVVGNHTYHHVNLTKIPIDEIATEWQACQDVVQSITGGTMRFCRPPGGDYDGDVITAAMALGLTTVLWTDDPGDYASPGDRTIDRRVLGAISSGGIVLLHDGVQQTLDILPGLIASLKRRGFRFETVEQMKAGLRPAEARASVARAHRSRVIELSTGRSNAFPPGTYDIVREHAERRSRVADAAGATKE
jgi:peptidoglycan/xylan/chitin deacetylase (PgdA/CDA1 family)